MTLRGTLRYYVSGPMRGIPKYNFPAFDHAAEYLRSVGIEAINPADHDREVEPDIEGKPHYLHGDASLNVSGPKFDELIRWDLDQIARPDCTGIVLLNGWSASSGAAIELAKAQALGKEVWELKRDGDDYAWVNFVPLHHRDPAPVYAGMAAWDGNQVTTDVKRQLADQLNRDLDFGPEPHNTADGYGVKLPPLDLGHGFVTKDSGKRVAFDSGMVRDTDDGKPRYDLIPLAPLRRLAELYARGAVKYGDRNWQKANSPEELARFKASAFRHFVSWLNGEVDEDHGIAVVWNIFAAEWLAVELDKHKRPDPLGGLDGMELAKAKARERIYGGIANGETQH